MIKNSSFFNKFNKTEVTISGKTHKVVDLLTRFRTSKKIEYTDRFFTKYEINEIERPDQIAYKYYGDVNMAWMVLFFNNIFDVYTELPMSSNSLIKEVKKRYQKEIKEHFIETGEDNYLVTTIGEYLDDDGDVITKSQWISEGGDLSKTRNIMDVYFLKNLEKSTIYLLKPEYVEEFLADLMINF